MESLNLFRLGADVEDHWGRPGVVEDVDYEDSTNVKYLVMWGPDDGEWVQSWTLRPAPKKES